jgi:chromodomain-helicase-DNA-binding protein 7
MRNVPNSYRFAICDQLVQSATEDEAAAEAEFISESVFSQERFVAGMNDSAASFLKRIEKQLYLPSEAAPDQPPIVRLAAGGFVDWWTDVQDQALISIAWMHGAGVFDHVPCDSDHPACRTFLSFPESIHDRRLTDRLLKLCDVAKKQQVSDDGVVDTLAKLKSKWPAEDQRQAISYLLRFGIERDEDGDPDYFAFAKGSDLCDHSEDDLRRFVEELLYQCNHPEGPSPIPYSTALRVTQRVATLSNLRDFMARSEDQLISFFNSAPKWRNLPKKWTAEHEIHFFRGIIDQGFGALPSILEDGVFADAFYDGTPPSCLLSDDAVLKRIGILDDFFKHPKSRSKRSKKEGEPKPVKVGTTANWEEIWNGGNVKLPLEVRPSSELICLGKVITDRDGFHSERYIFPAGYKCSRICSDVRNPDDRALYISEIVDLGGPKPVFRVYLEDDPSIKYEGESTSQPWTSILKQLSAKKKEKHANTISGPMAFGLDRPIVQRLIQQLPGAKDCKKYIWLEFADPEAE